MKRYCEYKDIAGKPGKGIHFHVFGIAIFDLIGTILIAILLSYLFNFSALIIFIILMIIAVYLHYIFCVPTTFLKLIGLAKDES